jgi:hypothetical protein
MADILRIKRRVSGAIGAPASLANAELSYNEVDHILYYGEGTGGAGGTASVISAIAGQGLAYTSNPAMNGPPNPGTQGLWSKGDHVHPRDTSKADLNNPSFTGTVTINGPITGAGMVAWSASPGPIGSTSASSGAFTTLSASGAVSGTGFTNYLASPPPIGSTLASTGAFTNLSVTGTLAGPGVTAALAGYALINSQVFTGTPSLPTGTIGVTQANTVNNTTLATTAYVRSVRLDQLSQPTAAVTFNSQFITNLQDPLNDQDAATKKYVDQNAAGLKTKVAVAVATTANLSTFTYPTTQPVIDGYQVAVNDRILIKDQASQQNNGIYVAVAGTWARSLDMDTWAEVPQAYVFVVNGAVNSSSAWVCNSAVGGTLGSTAITWVQFSQQASVTAGAGLTRTGNQFDVIGTTARIAVFADSIDIDSNYVGQASITTLGAITTGTWNGSTIAIARGGTGSTAIASGYVLSNGAALVSQTTIPNTVITGLGTMSTQNASNVVITGGTIGTGGISTPGITIDLGTF